MTDRPESLRSLGERLCDHDAGTDVWTPRGFTDRLFVVEVPPEETLPRAVRRTFHEHALREASDVYGVDASDADFAGQLSGGRRYPFVEV